MEEKHESLVVDSWPIKLFLVHLSLCTRFWSFMVVLFYYILNEDKTTPTMVALFKHLLPFTIPKTVRIKSINQITLMYSIWYWIEHPLFITGIPIKRHKTYTYIVKLTIDLLTEMKKMSSMCHKGKISWME